MAKRKTPTSSEDEDRSLPKKSKNIMNQSYIQTANLMSKTSLLHKGLNLSSDALMSKIKTEHISESESEEETTKRKSKVKKKPKKASANNTESDDERQSTIDFLINETRRNVLSKTKSKKNRKNPEKSSKSFTPIVIKQEPNDPASSGSNNDSSSDDNSRKSANVNRHKEDVTNNKGQEGIFNEVHEDRIMMESIENKVNVLQDLKISPSKKTPQQQLNEMYPHAKVKLLKTKFKLKDSHDVFLFRIPKSVNPQNFLNVEINLEEECKINIAGEKFLIRPTSKIPDATLVLSNKMEILNFKRNIVMEKYVKANKDPNIPKVEKSLVPLPNNLKNRHPLFGSNFEGKIQLDEIVEKKLDDAIKNLLKPTKKKKEHKSKSERMSLVNSTLLPDVSKSTFNPNVSSIFPRKKLKKEKLNDTTDDISIADLFGTQDSTKKRKKHKSSREAAVELGEGDRKSKKRKIEEDPDEFSPPKKKKKKKRDE